MILLTRIHLEEVLREIEWATLFFLIGLFILVGGLEITGVIGALALKPVTLTHDPKALTLIVLWTSAIASPIVDNVPYTATMISVIKSVGAQADINLRPL